MDRQYVIRQGVLIGALALVAQTGHASTLAQISAISTNFASAFQSVVWLLGYAALGTIVYSVAQRRYGVPFDEGISATTAVVLGVAAPTILGWAGATQGAELSQRVVDVLAMWP